MLGRAAFNEWHDKMCPHLAQADWACDGKLKWPPTKAAGTLFTGRTCWQTYGLVVLNMRCQLLVARSGRAGSYDVDVGRGQHPGCPFWAALREKDPLRAFTVAGPSSNAAFVRFRRAYEEVLAGGWPKDRTEPPA